MLSRVADALYWMARNSERTENNAHILGVQLVKMLEESAEESLNNLDWKTIMDICASSVEYEDHYAEMTTQNIVDYLAFSDVNVNSLASTTSIVRENARMIRDTIPNELWEEWNDLFLFLKKEKNLEQFMYRDIYYFLQRIKTTSMTATGIIDSSMARNLSYHFMKIGKWLERAEKTARIMEVSLQRTRDLPLSSYSELDGKFALQLVNGYDDFSKKYRLQKPEMILQYLIADRTFPRSIRYCMEHVKKVIMEIESEKVAHYSWEMFVTIDDILTSVNTVCIEDLSLKQVEEFVSQILDKCIKFGKIFSATYYLIEADIGK